MQKEFNPRYCKSNRYLIIALFFFGLALSLFVGEMHCQTSPMQNVVAQGNIVLWYDADTVKFRRKNGSYYRIRLQGIDAPERRQSFGLECRQKLVDATFGKTVFAMFYGFDTYKRTLGMIGTDEIPNINLWLIEQGCAWEYSAPITQKTLYQTAEAAARSSQLNLWSENCPTEPWKFRASGYNVCS